MIVVIVPGDGRWGMDGVVGWVPRSIDRSSSARLFERCGIGKSEEG